MAEAIAKAILEEKGEKERVRVISAGTSAFPGALPSKQAVQAMGEEGIDLGGQQATPLTVQLIEEADLVLTMTQSHREQILRMAPEAMGKVFLLKEFSQNPEEARWTLERQQDIHKAIHDKQADFFRRHGAAVESLNDEKERIIRRLKDVEGELQRYEAQLLEELTEERQALEDLEATVASLEVSDPYGRPVSVYRSCAKELRASIAVVLEKLLARKTST
jgi:protein-tyrosine phosphatase